MVMVTSHADSYYYTLYLNPLHAKFFRENKNIFLHFMSFFSIDITQAVENFSQPRQELNYST